MSSMYIHHLTPPHPKIVCAIKFHHINLCWVMIQEFHGGVTIYGHLLIRFLKAMQKIISENRFK